jgi:serine protease Do
MALGFADLDVPRNGDGDARPIHQYLDGSEARITEVQPPCPASTRAWPVFRVEADWPGGMSGGPAFNEAGHVIGVVSTAVVGAKVGQLPASPAGTCPSKRFLPSIRTILAGSHVALPSTLATRSSVSGKITRIFGRWPIEATRGA